MSEVVLNVKKMTKVYNLHMEKEFEALHDIDFQVMDGDFICIMGPSGSGKSTFINNISTIDMPTKGLVYIHGIEVHTMSANEIGKFRYRNLGFVFQDFNLLDSHTLYENIAMPLALAKTNKKDIQVRVHTVAKQMNIESLLNKHPYECSGGQKQRAAICRALITQPKIIIADEPTGNLDSQNSQELINIFKELNDKQKVTIIMVTHDALIASYANRLVYIKDGIIKHTLDRGQMNQDEFFQEIMQLNAQESRKLLK